ncbi:cytochrome P450 [Coprinopsis sp. MPI-PUGE-AT-0042]|nr:cytochrome P450 [Coprinopsis sp. MPI-PUGE-AT-0042]
MQDGVTKLLASLSATFGAYGLYKLLSLFYSQWTSPLRTLPGPARTSLLWGNMKEIFEAENSVVHEQWSREYGPTIRYRGLFGLWRLYTTDLKALSHILARSDIYQKPEPAKYALSQLLGDGLIVVEGEEHKNQRRVMNPAFSAVAIRELTEIFVEKSVELRDVLMGQVLKDGGKPINILPWLSRMTLEVIGLAGQSSRPEDSESCEDRILNTTSGFSYSFNALTQEYENNELHKAFSKILDTNQGLPLVPILRGMIPALRFLPAHLDAESKSAKRTMDRIAHELLERSKAAMDGNGKADADSVRGKNLLTLLLRANMATDLPEHQRMSDEEVLARAYSTSALEMELTERLSEVPTFLVAGHETTSTATTWALYSLCGSREVQKKLRAELQTVSSDNPSMDELNALPYLDAVVRETLRVHPPVASTLRVAVKDDILPLSTPYTDVNGDAHTSVPVHKGQTLFLPIVAVNRDKTLWGEDALEFRPERWEKVPEAVSAIPNIWGNMLTFLAGPRACIGYRFSLVETKAILFTLLRAFEFELAVPFEDIGKKAAVVQRPILKSDKKAGNQLPLIIKPVQQ